MRTAKAFLFALGLSVSAFCIFGGQHAFAATKTWTGGGSDSNMSTGANWGGSAPSAGDDLVFPIAATSKTVTNNMTAGTSFNSIAFTGTTTGNTGYTITGNAIALVDGITNTISGSSLVIHTISLPIAFSADQTITVDGPNTMTFDGVLSGSGNLTLDGTSTYGVVFDAANTFTGSLTISIPLSGHELTSFGTSAGATIVNAGGSINLTVAEADKAGTISEPFTLNADAEGGLSGMAVDAGCGFSQCDDSDLTMSGAIVLGADITFFTAGKVTITGALSGAYKLEMSSSATGQLVIDASSNTSETPNGTYGPGLGQTTTYSDNKPSQNIVAGNTDVAIVTGTYGSVTVSSGGTLKGTGTVASVFIASGGFIAPGLSPGCLTMTALTVAGTFSAELGGTTACTEYDQLIVNGTADITNGTLGVSLVNSFKPKAGQKFLLINNDSNDAIVGTFNGLAQGATFKVNGYTFSISYTGGDGNDVELTVTAVAPDTGFELLTSNPYLTMSLMLGAAGAIAFMARRSLKPAHRKR